jgi:hypothetical protein
MKEPLQGPNFSAVIVLSVLRHLVRWWSSEASEENMPSANTVRDARNEHKADFKEAELFEWLNLQL